MIFGQMIISVKRDSIKSFFCQTFFGKIFQTLFCDISCWKTSFCLRYCAYQRYISVSVHVHMLSMPIFSHAVSSCRAKKNM
jgi:hypothetical protein